MVNEKLELLDLNNSGKIIQVRYERLKQWNLQPKLDILQYSPYKLRPIADVIRGKNVAYALELAYQHIKHIELQPIKKVLRIGGCKCKNLQ